MAVIFADSFDMYFTSADMTTQWSALNGNPQTAVNTAFNLGQSYQISSTNTATFTSGTNETTVYGSIRVKPVTGAGYINFTLNDAGTAQCTIRFNYDGSIGLYTGGPTGTLIQTYTGVYVINTWNGCQFKVVINNTTGSIELRLNGATSNTITKTGVNTRGGTANAFVNGFSVGVSGSAPFVDDIFINNTSGNAPTSWPGDVRAVQQAPVLATQTNFSVFPVTTSVVGGGNQIGTNTCTNGNSYYGSFIASASGKIGSVVFVTNASATANMKFALFDNTGPSGGPGSSLGTSGVVVNPVSGNNTATWSSPVSVVKGVTYWIGWSQDATVVTKVGNSAGFVSVGTQTSATAYASFPAANPTISQVTTNMPSITVTITNDNAVGVQELVEDGDTSYVYTSSVTEDKYSLTAISTAYTVVAMQYFAMYKRSDVGSRTMQLSVAANGSGDTAIFTDAAISNTYVFKFNTNELDPTGATWTAANVNGAILGLSVTA